ncbi:phage tail tape measure protein [Clostridium botulinum]|uniref:Phage tail tape measure protein n=2 Tax=Clostridium botulinum TaxID=1491 RepID=A0A6M0SSJ1_CLOBO|nr:phage tail tape measure protein [Clostridium botulinum]NFO35147.1 phage tail tape measure protein [Clostridium botulinum]NFO48375.1 phage tail tape measure protein [Clostridium botulinum]
MANKVINTILNLKDNFSKSLKKTTDNTNKFKKQMKLVEMQGRKMEQAVSKSFKAIGAIAGVSAGAMAAGAVKGFMDLEQSTANVSATLGSISTPEILEDYRNKAIELSDTMSRSSKEVMDAFNYLALAGWKAEDSLANVKYVVQSSVVGAMDLAVCSDKITDSLSALGLKANDTETYTNTLALAQSKGNATMENLLDTMLAVGGTFKNFNIPLNESVAVLDKLADQGLKGAEAGNSMSAIMVNLMGKTGAAKDELKRLNLTMFEANGKTKNFTKYLFEVKQKLSGMTEEQRNTSIALIAGKNQLDAFNKLLNGTDENLVKLSEELKNTDGALEKAAMTMDDTIIGRFKILCNSIKNTGILMVDKFAPDVKNALEQMQKKVLEMRPTIVSTFEKIVGVVKNLIKVIDYCSPAIGGICAALLTLMVVSKVSRMIDGLKAAFMGLKALATPVGLVALAIGVLVGAFIYFYKTSETFRNKVDEILVSIQNFAMWLGSILVPAFQEVYAWIQENIIPIFQKMGDKLTEVWVNNISPTLASLTENFMIIWQNVLLPFGEFLGGLFVAYFKTSFELISNIISTTVERFADIITALLEILNGLLDFIVGIFTGNWSKAWDGIKEIFSGIFDGMLAVAKTVVNGIIDLVNGAISGINNFTSIDIPVIGNIGFTIPSIPKFATGTSYFSGGLAQINEHGGEMAVLPGGSKVIPADKTDKLMDGKSNINIHLTVQGNVIGNHEFVDEMGNLITDKILIALNNN